MRLAILLLLATTASPLTFANTRTLTDHTGRIDAALVNEDYKRAGIALVEALRDYPTEPKLLSRAKRFQRIVAIRQSLDQPMVFEYSKQYEEMLFQRELMRKYFAPTNAEIIVSLAATLGVLGLGSWAESLVEDQTRNVERSLSVGSEKKSHSAGTSTREVSSNEPAPKVSPSAKGWLTGVIRHADNSLCSSCRVRAAINGSGMTDTVYTDKRGRFRLTWHSSRSVAKLFVNGKRVLGRIVSGEDIQIRLD